MASTTDKQLRFMRMVKARQRGHPVGGPSVQRAARTMQPGDVEDFQHMDAMPKKPMMAKPAAARKQGRFRKKFKNAAEIEQYANRPRHRVIV